MIDHFFVPPEKEPTEQEARDAASGRWSHYIDRFPGIFTENGRGDFIETTWEDHLLRLRRQVGIALPSADYCEDIPENDLGHAMTIAVFRKAPLTDQDGYGRPIRDGKLAQVEITPSLRHLIPLDATGIFWINR